MAKLKVVETAKGETTLERGGKVLISVESTDELTIAALAGGAAQLLAVETILQTAHGVKLGRTRRKKGAKK